jgi:hypothetical protein
MSSPAVENRRAAAPTTAPVLNRQVPGYQHPTDVSRDSLQEAGRVLLLLTQTSRPGHEPADLWRLLACRLRRAYAGVQR